MNLGTFQTLVSSSLRRGTTLDSFIPQQVQMAVMWLERNYTFKYMENFRLLQIAQGDRVITLPTDGIIKAFKFVRIVNRDGTYSYLKKVEPEDLGKVDSAANTLTGMTVPAAPSTQNTFLPTAYFIVGNKVLVLNAIPSAALAGESVYYTYTDWPSDASSTHPLLDIAADLLLAQTQMFFAANVTKDLRMVPAYKELRDEAVNTLTRAEDETKFGGESISMIYNPQYDQRLVNQPNRGT